MISRFIRFALLPRNIIYGISFTVIFPLGRWSALANPPILPAQEGMC